MKFIFNNKIYIKNCYLCKAVKRFAIFPIKIGNEIRLLETCYILRTKYEGCNKPHSWKNERFITKEDYYFYIQKK
jgi:hypothetical protein